MLPLPAAAGQLDVIQALAGRGLDLAGRPGCAVLAAAVHSGAAPLVAWLLEEGRCDVGAALGQEDLLHEAASRGDVEVLQALLGAAGDACLDRTDGRGLGRTPLHSAVLHGRTAAAEMLIDAQQRAAGASGGQQGQAQEQQQADVAAEAAPEAAAAPGGLNAADSQGYTALHWAAAKGSTGVLRRLLAAGAGREAVAQDGMSPLHLAAKAGHVGAVHALRDAGCTVTGAPAVSSNM